MHISVLYWISLPVFSILGIPFCRRQRRRFLLFSNLFFALALLPSCGGGAGSGGGAGGGAGGGTGGGGSTGTPSGTYSLTIQATSGADIKTASVSLNVQ